MKHIHLGALDLNLLRILSVLTEERSVTKAGDRLGLTQSAVSHALARMRAIFDDPLLVRGPRGMQPTQRAIELAVGVRLGLAQIESALAPPFDSATTDRRFTIISGGYVSLAFGPVIVERLMQTAPRAELRLRNYDDDMYALLDTGQADAMIAGYLKPPDRFASVELFTDEFAWAVRSDHPVARGRLSVETLSTLPAAVIDRPSVIKSEEHASAAHASGVWYDRGAFDAALADAGLVQRVGVTAPDALSALAIVARSDMITLTPRRLAAAYLGPGHFALLDPPYPSPAFAIKLIYRRDSADDPARAWLISLLREAGAAFDRMA